jgi:hypothetical protein
VLAVATIKEDNVKAVDANDLDGGYVYHLLSIFDLKDKKVIYIF